MRVVELSLRNYRVFERVDLELPARVIGIFGPNGSGKSSLCESVLWALYGATRTDKRQIRTHGVLTDCEVRLVFEHGGGQYEVRRVVKGKNHQVQAELLAGGASLAVGVREVEAEVRQLLRMDQQVFRASVFAEQKQLDAFSDLTRSKRQEMVLRLLGIRPVDEARTAARREAREAKGRAGDLAGALPDLSEQEAALEAARETHAKATARADEAAETLEAARSALDDARSAFEEADAARQEVETVTGRLEEAREATAALTRRRDDLAGRIETLRERLAALPALREEAEALAGARDLLERARGWAEASEELRAAERALAGLPPVDAEAALKELEQMEAALREAEGAAHRAAAAAEAAAGDLDRATVELSKAGELDPTKPCPTCGQALGEAFGDVVVHREAEVRDRKEASVAAAKAARAAEIAREEAAGRHAGAVRRGEEARAAAERRTALEREAEKLRSRVAERAEPFGGEAPDLEEIEARATRGDEVGRELATLQAEAAHLEGASGDLAGADEELGAAEARVAALTAQLEAAAFDPSAHAELRTRFEGARSSLEQAQRDEREASDAAKDAEREMARLEGDLTRVRETAEKVTELREEARYAERVSLLLDGFRGHLYARIVPELSREAEALFRELTNHEYEDLRISDEDLAIEIADGGAYFPIERFSGSETDLANLALRAAISAHLSRMSGADVGMMVLDEVLASLDAERKDLMVQAMGRLANRFHQLFVVTHAEQVKDQFPASIEVRKVGRRRSEAVLV